MLTTTRTMQEEDEALSGNLTLRLQHARRELLDRMARRGLQTAEGWRIHEELASTPRGMAYILRAVHRVHASTADLEVSVPVTS